MKDSSGNIKQYTAEDIRRYVQDEMSPAEMHAIEKAALDDPFLADAIEGFSSGISEHGLASVEKSAVNLQTAFAERIKGKKKRGVVAVVRMKWWQAAVAASIIVTAGVLGYRSYNDRTEELLISANEDNNKDKAELLTVDSVPPQTSTRELHKSDKPLDVAKVEERDSDRPAVKSSFKKNSENTSNVKDQDPAPSKGDNASATGEKSLVINQKADTEKQKTITTNRLPVAKQAGPTNDKPVQLTENDKAIENKEVATTKRISQVTVPSKKSEESESGKAVAANLQTDTTGSKVPSPPGVKLSGKVAGVDFESSKATSANQSPLNYFNGQIVTSDNKPLSNAVLKMNNNPTVYTTDNNGKFRIASRDSVIEVEASMVGRETTRFRLQKDDEANNLLLPDAVNSLNEVVVIGYGTQRKKDITGSVTVSRREAEPEGGWLVWEQYLQSNKDSTLVLNGTAETEISFHVTAKNKLSQFRIIRSISAKHDQEVIRLIKEGPKWHLRKGKKATVSITMRF